MNVEDHRFRTAQDVLDELEQAAFNGKRFAMRALAFIERQDIKGYAFAWEPMVRNLPGNMSRCMWYRAMLPSYRAKASASRAKRKATVDARYRHLFPELPRDKPIPPRYLKPILEHERREALGEAHAPYIPRSVHHALRALHDIGDISHRRCENAVGIERENAVGTTKRERHRILSQ
jgi:hypothetical protein